LPARQLGGAEKIAADFPAVRQLTAATYDCLDDRKFIVPGLGDFGDRYFETD